MPGVSKKPTKSGKFRGWYMRAPGDQKFFTGTRSRAETMRMARKLEDDHHQVRLGYRDQPKQSARHSSRLFEAVSEEYLAWGESQGGRGGMPWGKTHARNRSRHLEWWHVQLGLQTLGELTGILPRVERALRKLQKIGRAGKTVANYAESLAALCDWCVDRGYLSEDPLRMLGKFDTTPLTQRRSMTAEEICQLLDACAPHRRLLLETAFQSGLRVNELRNLTVDHLDVQRRGLLLDAEWTKNRKPGFQPLPAALVEHLLRFGQSGAAGGLYERFYRRSDASLKAPERPLLYVPSHPSRDLAKDLAAADIPKHTAAGKVDFHACRVAYINLVIESGVTVKEAQTLARHSTPQLTMNLYGRTRDDRLVEAVEKVGKALQRPEKHALCMHPSETARVDEEDNPSGLNGLNLCPAGGGGGNRTRVRRRSARSFYMLSSPCFLAL